MPLELHPLQEADLPAYDEIIHEAFRGDIGDLLYPNGYTPADRTHSLTRALQKWRQHPQTVQKTKVIDTALPDTDPLNKIISVADWNFHPQERSEAELDAADEEGQDAGFPPSANIPFMKHFFGLLSENKRRILGGKPHILLHILVTHPRHHRRGVGAMQLEWGVAEARRLGVPVYLESSPMGRPLYERFGFETVGWLELDAREWGLDHDLPHALMLRPADAETVVGEAVG
ncbi:hypothetical protein B0A50_05564 [Salinomyces thailandicus]|uniref:N-acetyltransferase domain-containing protein n=1 Tax=Salinomyces thailandicus TaxID=706561 RepID=A0A4V5N5L0_9PEZI|nr:hypothetical protein B0A50_05564 [Salinomyces thailandica]